MKVIVAGGAGFIGSHLARRLASDAHDVIVLDNLLTGSQRNVDLLAKFPNIEFILQDITDNELPNSDKWGKIDAIFDMACPASPVDFDSKAIEIMRVSAQGTYNLLEIARKHDARFLQASTSECYGDPLVNPQPETYWGNVNPIGPRSCYDEGKRYAEAIIMAYHRKYNLKTRIARIFNTYGPDMRHDDGRVLSNFVCQALQNQSISVYGDGSQTRSFCYVDDLVEGLIRLLNSDFAEPVNLGNPQEIPIIQLAKEVIELTGSQSKIINLPLPADDPKLRRPDISRAKKLLDWSPMVDRVKGIEKTIPYFRDLLEKLNG